MGLPSFHSGYPAFLQKKWRLENFIVPRHSEPHFEAETSEFGCEMIF